MKKTPAPLASPEALLRYDDWVRALLKRMIADEHAAEDATQDLWVAALERPPTHSAAGSGGWPADCRRGGG